MYFAARFNRPVVVISRAVRPIGSSHALWRAFTLVAAVSGLALAGCRGEPTSVFVELAEARRLAADLRVQFNRASDASNRAVMADTDEASVAFAHEAEQTKQVVQTDAVMLAPHLRNLGYANEARLLEEFTKRFADYLNLDRTVLELAVENTNLKAQRLSFGPARVAADAFRDALEALVRVAAAKDRCHIESAVARAVLAVREVQVLQAPHIAEADDAAMARMEAEMGRLQAVAADCLNELSGLVEQTQLAPAWSAIERFKDVSLQIVALSRRNSNVRSLALSLRDKPALTAACDDSLRSLDDALAKEGFRATR
jgi:hypothetical protein